jgi:hypothetical protein
VLRRGPRVICEVGLTVGVTAKHVAQLEKGAQSKPLWALANGILDLTEGHAASGTTAASLGDGLEKLIAGQLKPETLDLTIHHRPDRGGRSGTSGWILRVDGGVASADDYGEADSPRRRTSLRLGSGDVIDLARALQHHDAAGLPGNIYFADYTDLHLGVLDREHAIQARQFAGMSEDARARGRVPFERLLATFAALHQRVIEQGQPAK